MCARVFHHSSLYSSSSGIIPEPLFLEPPLDLSLFPWFSSRQSVELLVLILHFLSTIFVFFSDYSFFFSFPLTSIDVRCRCCCSSPLPLLQLGRTGGVLIFHIFLIFSFYSSSSSCWKVNSVGIRPTIPLLSFRIFVFFSCIQIISSSTDHFFTLHGLPKKPN